MSWKKDPLKQRLDLQVRRIEKAKRESATLLSQTVFLGTLGLMLVLPIVAGAYFGRWLDSLVEGYSVRWSVSMIVLGVFVGTVNVYYFINQRD